MTPMAAFTTDNLPEGDERLYELKSDGSPSRLQLLHLSSIGTSSAMPPHLDRRHDENDDEDGD